MGIGDRIGKVGVLLGRVRTYTQLITADSFEESTIADMKDNAKDLCDQAKDEIDRIKDEIDEWS